MRQAFHIFLKDTRRSWPFAVVNAIISAALAILVPRWTPFYTPVERFNYIVDYLYILLPIAWWLTIAHVVQAESLAGDRAFWLTRPYSRWSLLAAKALFCVAFLLAPLFVGDCFILRSAGFRPSEMPSQFLLHYALLTVYLILPVAAAAALTRDFRQFALVVVALAVAFFGAIWLAFQFGPRHIAGALLAPSDGTFRAFLSNWGDAITLAAIASALVVLQYARRVTVQARWAAGFCAAVACFSSLTPEDAFARAIANDSYPEVTAALSSPSDSRRFRSVIPNLVEIDIPVRLTGRPRNLLEGNVAAVRLLPPAEVAAIDTRNLFPQMRSEPDGDWIVFTLDANVLRKLNEAPLELEALLAISVYEDVVRTSLAAKEGFQSIPGGGEIALDQGFGPPDLWIRFPFHPSTLRTVCSVHATGSRLVGPVTFDDYDSGDSSWLHLNPVISAVQPLNRDADMSFLLPASSIDVDVQRRVAVLRRDVRIPAIRLQDYAAPR